MTKHPLISALAGAVVLLLLAALLVPFFINVNSYRSPLETQVSSALGRKVTLGNLSLSVFSASLVAHNISIADDPAFSSKPFFEAPSLHIGVEVVPLLLHRQLLVTRVVADSPSINLVRNAQGVWNFSHFGSTAPSRTPSPEKETAPPTFTLAQMRVVNGTVLVSDTPSTGPGFAYSKLNLSVQQFSFADAFPFMLTASLPGGGLLDIHGNAGPVNQQDTSETPLGANIQLKHFDPVAAGVVQKSQGFSMLADIAAQITTNGPTVDSKGTVRAANLQLVADGTPTPSPVDITYTITHNLTARSGQITDLAITTGEVAAHVTGTYAIQGGQTNLALHLSAPNLPIDQLEALLPAAGVRLPSGSRLQGGTLSANLSVSGPAIAPVISGPVALDNTRLTGFDLSSKIGGLKPVSGSQGSTAIQTLRGDLNSSQQGTRIENLYASIPPLGTATGGGTIAPGGALDFDLVAKVNTTSAGMKVGGGILGQALSSAAADGIAVHISGTTSNPVFEADLSKLLQKEAGNLLKQQLLGNGNKTNSRDLLNKLFHH